MSTRLNFRTRNKTIFLIHCSYPKSINNEEFNQPGHSSHFFYNQKFILSSTKKTLHYEVMNGQQRTKLISDVLLWTPTYGRAKAGRPARTYIQQLCEDTGCSPEDLPDAMNDREKWRERVRDIRASGST